MLIRTFGVIAFVASITAGALAVQHTVGLMEQAGEVVRVAQALN